MSDKWDFYRLLVDYEPASIMVDLGIRENAPLKSHTFMGYLRTRMNNPQPNGLSSQAEFDKLCEIGDAVDREIEASDGQHLYVGRNTSSNNRDYYFYTADIENLSQSLDSIIQKFPDYRFEKGNSKDADWSTYLDYLYPSPVQLRQMMDRRVCEQLTANGDDLSIKRDIDHLVYFKDRSKLKTFRTYLEQGDFHDLKIGKTKPLFGDIYMHFKHFGAPKDIYDIVYHLFNKSEELGGVYDGWGCSVERTTESS